MWRLILEDPATYSLTAHSSFRMALMCRVYVHKVCLHNAVSDHDISTPDGTTHKRIPNIAESKCDAAMYICCRRNKKSKHISSDDVYLW